MLLVEDHQLVLSIVLEYVNSLISAGEVAGLYLPEELEGTSSWSRRFNTELASSSALLAQLAPAATEEGWYGTVHEFFIARIRRNLHIVVVADPSHPDFAHNCESNPALFTGCNILWMEGWSEKTMAKIPKQLLKKLHVNLQDDDKTVVLELLQHVHETELQAGAGTPRQYISLVNTYESVLRLKRSVQSSQQGGFC